MVKVSNFLIGLVLIGGLSAIFGLFFADLSSNYAVPFNESDYAVYNQLDSISNQTKDIKERAEGIKEKAGALDVLNSMFSDAYSATKITLISFDTFDTMANKAVDDANMGASGEYIKIMVSSIILILIVIGVLISALMRYQI